MPSDSTEDLPGTIRRSPNKAQRTYAETLESAHEEYDSEERARPAPEASQRAHRTAYASLNTRFEKVVDHREPKKAKGPSDERARRGQRPGGESAGGVDVFGHTKQELYE